MEKRGYGQKILNTTIDNNSFNGLVFLKDALMPTVSCLFHLWYTDGAMLCFCKPSLMVGYFSISFNISYFCSGVKTLFGLLVFSFMSLCPPVYNYNRKCSH